MRVAGLILTLGLCLLSAQTSVIVYQAQMGAMAGDLNFTRQLLAKVRNAIGVTPEYIEALSWLGRGELNAKNFAGAEQNAAEVRKLSLERLGVRRLDSDPRLANALGASIEVQAQAAVAQKRRDEAVLFLREELKRWHDTSIRPRIQKNLNLLTLEGKPAPPLDVAHALTGSKLETLAQHRGHPVLLFFWAHWCSDCKNEIQVIARLEQAYRSRGLIVIAPTQHYGYVAGGQDASREAETAYIKAVYAQYYAALGPVEVPLSEENFANYGVSTTPTLVLVDRKGIVRLYNPGTISYEQLAAKLQPLLPTT